MIIFIFIDLNDLRKKGRDYTWTRPKKCFVCGRYRIWGHGFVDCLFDGFENALPLKRYRCPDCRSVFRLRPVGYFSRFQASILKIRACIASKAETGKWLRDFPRTRQNHWYRALFRHISAYLGNTWKEGVIRAFDFLLSRGMVPVTRRI